MQARTRALRTVLLAVALVTSAALPAVAAPAGGAAAPIRSSAETVGYSLWAPYHTVSFQGRAFGRLDREPGASEWKHQAWCVDKGTGYTSVSWKLHRAGLAPSTVGGFTCNDEVKTETTSAVGPFTSLTVSVCKSSGLLRRRCASQDYAVPA
jgi:hypothetical protein